MCQTGCLSGGRWQQRIRRYYSLNSIAEVQHMLSNTWSLVCTVMYDLSQRAIEARRECCFIPNVVVGGVQSGVFLIMVSYSLCLAQTQLVGWQWLQTVSIGLCSLAITSLARQTETRLTSCNSCIKLCVERLLGVRYNLCCRSVQLTIVTLYVEWL